MPTFEPITSSAQLPPPKTRCEGTVRDFKREHRDKDRGYELAKDMAALANRLGGTIIVGMDEVDGVVSEWTPLATAELAGKAIDDYSTALNHCHPQPLMGPERIEVDGGFVVAINVWASPSQLIGVRHPNSDVYFRFPIRAGNQSSHIHPESFALHMDAQLRRIVILLSAIPDGARVVLTDKAAMATRAGIQYGGRCRIDEMKNTVTFPVISKVGTPRVVCLDDITTAYEETNNSWIVGVRVAR